MADASNDYLIVGKIFSAHGINGYVKIFPLTDDIERFYDLKNVYTEELNKAAVLTVDDILIKDKVVLVKFKQIKNRTDAEKLKGTFIYVHRREAVKLEDDEYFIQDLIGLECYDMNNRNIGRVEEIIQTGSVDVFVIKGQSQFLIPALKKNVWPMLDKCMIKVDTSGGVESD